MTGTASAEASAAPAPERRSRPDLAALLGLAVLAGIWAWWALKEGGYFGVVLLPGGIVLCLALALLIGLAPRRMRLSVPVAVAFAALLALGVWSALSALWSPAPDVAITDGQRIAIYAVAFLLGVWSCALLGSRRELSLAPLTVAAAAAGGAAVIALITSDVPRDVLEHDGTLDFPLGYRNAEAAFFGIALFAALGLSGSRELDWRLRGIALGVTTLCLDLVVLCQSRATIAALPLAVIAYLLISPKRLRALSWLVLAALPALAVLGPASDLYGAADGGLRGAVEEMHAAGWAVAWTTLVGLALGSLAARFEPRLPGLRSGPGSNRWVAYGIALALIAGAIAFVVRVGDPVDWADQRLDEFRAGYSETLGGPVGRFTVDVGSNRNDLWRVALDDFAEDPLKGDGGGGYEYSWLRKRVATQEARDAHSVELEVMSELGLPGLLLLVAALGGAVVGIVRARATGPASAALAASALAAGTYWLVHASVDWFWPYPAVTAPLLALLGAACAPALAVRDDRGPGLARGAAIAGLAVFCLLAVPPFLSERYINDAYAGWRQDPARAYEDLDNARTLNPLSDTPLLAEGVIAREAGDRRRAIDAFRAASRKRPEGWAARYLLAELLQSSDPSAARAQIRTAIELNPRGDRIAALAERLGVRRGDGGER